MWRQKPEILALDRKQRDQKFKVILDCVGNLRNLS